MTRSPVQLRIGVVGAGRVGAVLGAALARAGHNVVAASGVSERSRKLAQHWLPQAQILPPDEVVAAADLVLLAVPDDALRALVNGLAATQAWRPGQIVAHTCGAHGIGVLDAASSRGVVPLALHPVMTFAGRGEDLDRLQGAPFGVTALDEMRAVAETLVVEIGGEPVWVPELARPAYHAALSMSANYLVTIINDSLDLLDASGVEQADHLVAPLLSAALDNVLRLRDGALTGPVSRGDAGTVATHLATLRSQAPQVVSEYIELGRRTADRAHKSGQLSDEGRAAVDAVLRAQ
jgi:predicted short-subunit dehydrogenase-like oxidoreductase (DUF2520 family)